MVVYTRDQDLCKKQDLLLLDPDSKEPNGLFAFCRSRDKWPVLTFLAGKRNAVLDTYDLCLVLLWVPKLFMTVSIILVEHQLFGTGPICFG